MFRYLISGDIVSAILFLLSGVFIVFCTLPIHETAHAYVAYKLGDNTAKYQGRLTLNPLSHIDPIGGLMILLFGFGWAKPVPVNMWKFKRPNRDMAITALAGPVSNILLAFLFMLIYNVLLVTGVIAGYSTVAVGIHFFIVQIISINLYLAVFNLLPIPPLDGSRLLNAFLPDRIYYKIMQNENYIMIAVLVLIATGVLSTPLSWIADWLYNGLSWIAGLPFRFLG